jgi:hypothetical protein
VLLSGDQQTIAEGDPFFKGAERAGTRRVRVEGDDPLAVYQSFAGITYITRVAEGR